MTLGCVENVCGEAEYAWYICGSETSERMMGASGKESGMESCCCSVTGDGPSFKM